MTRTISGVCLLWLFTQCGAQRTDQETPVIEDEFASYWFSGKAEVASYELSQSRYGEPREGDAVLIFVTEPFSGSEQVKLDNPEEAGDDKVTVMKLNMMKNFVTGIYPYSMMLSVFSPVDNQAPPHPLKYTMSSQEWCGQVFAQINRSHEEYKLREFSYFQSEGDNTRSLPVMYAEDELWNLIRLDPASLPAGEFKIYPGLFHTRLMHRPFTPADATGTLTEEGGQYVYKLVFASGRTFTWYFDKSFPHTIQGWEERFPAREAIQITTARLKKRLHIPYWQYNGREDIIWRDSLRID